MATEVDLRLPQALDFADIANEWPKWKQAFAIYLRATNKIKESEENKIANFLWLIGPRGVEIYNTLFPEEMNNTNLFAVSKAAIVEDATDDVADDTNTLGKVIAAFDEYCTPKKNVAMEAYTFNCIEQKERQTFAEFESELRTQAAYCEFKCTKCQTPYTDRMIHDRIIVGVQDKNLQLKLLNGKDDPLANVVQTCKVFEAANEPKTIETQTDVTGEIWKKCGCGKAFTQGVYHACLRIAD